MVDVAQLVEHRIVAPVVVGSIPIVHPIAPVKSKPAGRSPPLVLRGMMARAIPDRASPS
jgi:hypothetical protein